MKTRIFATIFLFVCVLAQAGMPMRPSFSTDVNKWSYACTLPSEGGIASSFTCTGVMYWFRDTYAAGLRSKHYRVNLFCGGGFATGNNATTGSPCVPGIRDYGNARDSSVAAASTWTYVESGSTGGLTASAGSVLDPGIVPSSTDWSKTSLRVAVYSRTAVNTTTAYAMGCQKNGAPFSTILGIAGSYVDGNVYEEVCSNSGLSYADSNGVGYYSVSRTSGTLEKGYKNGVPMATNTVSNAAESLPDLSFLVFGFRYNVGTFICTKQLAAYEISSGLTDAEEALSYAAMQRLQTWFGRNL